MQPLSTLSWVALVRYRWEDVRAEEDNVDIRKVEKRALKALGAFELSLLEAWTVTLAGDLFLSL